MEITKDIETAFNLACRSEATVLILGPTGSGKTSLARQIHDQSRRKSRPFVTVNLATLHEGTIESELFGHERGAFTGAESRRVGRFEFANGGTVFLDEIAELPLRLQARLLEFLQSRVIVPVGSNREARLDVRIIAATHKDLKTAVAKGEFREDLFHRLRVISMSLKSLIERGDDFDRLMHCILEEICRSNQRSILNISEEVACRLEAYEWPGNFRELRNVLETAVLSCEGNELKIEHLPSWFFEPTTRDRSGFQNSDGAKLLAVAEFPMTLDFHGTLSRFEKEYLELALRRFRGRISLTARQIGMSKATLLRRIRAYGIRLGPELG